MGVIKLENLDLSCVTLSGDYLLYNNEPFQLKTNFQSIKPYGLPKKNEYHKTDESRMYYQVPITDDNIINIIKELGNKFPSSLNILKEGKESFPPSIKIKFNKDTIFSLTNEKINEITVVEYDNIDDLDKKMKFYYDFRFLFSVRPWKYMGKSGFTLLASHVQAVIKNSPTLVKDFV